MAKRKNSGGGSSLLTLGLVAVGGYVVYEMFFATPAVASTVTTTPTGSTTTAVAPASTISTVTPAGSPTAPTGSTLDSLYTAMIALITKDKDPQFTGSGSGLSASGWQFNYYLQLVGPSLSIPDPTVVFGGTPAATGPMTAAAYWAKMAPALQASNAGLAGMGLGMYGGMGAYLQGLGAYRW